MLFDEMQSPRHQHPDVLEEPLRRCALRWMIEDGLDRFIDDEDELAKAREQLKRTYNAYNADGELRVRYKRTITIAGKEYGRLYAVKGVGLQTMKREVRGALLRDAMANSPGVVYKDIDMANAQPTILLHACWGEHVPHLKDYVENREQCLKAVMEDSECSRSVAKNLFITLLYFGDYRTWCFKHGLVPREWSVTCKIARQFSEDVIAAVDAVPLRLPDAFTDKAAEMERTKRSEAAREGKPVPANLYRKQLMYIALSSYEDYIRENASRSVAEQGGKVVAHMHDGLIIRDDHGSVDLAKVFCKGAAEGAG
uniref:Uncharacterized protein n=1 Tax=Tetraselmis sp. GSL018 TaxID=582737 RepID=A0A061QUT7_9CHLO